MTLLKNKNFAYSSLAAGITAGSTSVTVATGEGIRFPSSGTFIAAIWGGAYPSPGNDPDRELVEMSFTSGDAFTITRGQEDTSAKAWISGDNIAVVLSAGKMDELEDYMQSGLLSFQPATGTNAYTAAMDPAIGAYVHGACYHIRFNNAATGTCTLQLNALTPKKLYLIDTVTGEYRQATSGDIIAGMFSSVFYDSTQDSGTGGWILVSSKIIIPDEFTTGDSLLFYQASPPAGWNAKTNWAGNTTIIAGNSFSSGAGADDPINWETSIALADHANHTHIGPSHAHTGPSHNHMWYNYRAGAADQSYNSAGTLFTPTNPDENQPGIYWHVSASNPGEDLYTNKAGTGSTGLGGAIKTAPVTEANAMVHIINQCSYQPRYAVMILGVKA